MREYVKQSKLIVSEVISKLKEQTVIAVVEGLSDDYIKDRHIAILKQIDSLDTFIDAVNAEYSCSEDDDLTLIRELCNSVERFDAENTEEVLDLVERAISLCEHISLATFSELQGIVTDLVQIYDFDDFADRYENVIVSIDKLGLNCGYNGILSEGSLEYLVEFCEGPNIGKSRVIKILNSLKDNYVFDNDLVSKYVDKLEEIQEDKMDIF